MPKETVQYPGTAGNSGTEISVHWSKGPDAPAAGYVQIAATRHVWTPNPKLGQSHSSHADHRNCSECVPAAQSAWESEDGTVGHGPAADDAATVWSDELSRDEINKFIRALRRARDQAYGTDA